MATMPPPTMAASSPVLLLQGTTSSKTETLVTSVILVSRTGTFRLGIESGIGIEEKIVTAILESIEIEVQGMMIEEGVDMTMTGVRVVIMTGIVIMTEIEEREEKDRDLLSVQKIGRGTDLNHVLHQEVDINDYCENNFVCSSKRTSGFDMGPPSAAMLSGPAVPGQLPGPPQPTPGMFQNAFSFGTSQLGSLPMMPMQAMTQQATRHARRVYVGGLPPLANEQTIATYFSRVMAAIGGNAAGPGDAVVNVYINHEKKFAFVEMRTVEEASNAMSLDGIMFEGVSVRVRRPTDYNPVLAAALGPSQASPHLNLSAIGLTPGSAIGGAEGPDRIFVGGLPYYFTEVQIKELLESFGPLRGFDLVKDRDTGNSKGYGFCIYQDPAVTDVACAALNGLKMGDKTLTVRRATASGGEGRSDQENILAQAQQHIAIQKMVLQAGGVNLPLGVGTEGTPENPTKVLCLNQAISPDDLKDNEEFEEILDDMRDECGKFGALANIIIPRPNPNGEWTPGIGKVFLEYSDIEGSTSARNALNGRKFGGNSVSATYYPEETFYNRDYSA